MKWQVCGRSVELKRTLLMGVLNVTPDSFSDGGKYLNPQAACERAEILIRGGADILDLGAESTRPNAVAVSEGEEIQRLLPVIRALRGLDVLISIDTTKVAVARMALHEGAHILNDVSGLRESGPEMARLARETGAGLVLMHRRGTPATMMGLAQYQDLIEEVKAELKESVQIALGEGVNPSQIVLDPGLGFSKKAEHNYQIVREIKRFHELGFPILLGPSRKSFLGEATGKDVDHREYSTAAACALAVFQGVQILRVHEPEVMRDAVRVAEAIRGV